MCLLHTAAQIDRVINESEFKSKFKSIIIIKSFYYAIGQLDYSWKLFSIWIDPQIYIITIDLFV